MTSLTTMFVVGPNEYVEFNESMGSKAFLEHVWAAPLDQSEVASGTLHSAGARISPTPPPRVEFPTVFKVKGKGNTYKASGKWISWDDLARLNPLAIKPPPSMDEFKQRGGQVGTGPRLKPGGLLGRDEPMSKVKKQLNAYTEEDGWIGGSSESIYAAPVVVKKKAPETPARASEKKTTTTTPERTKFKSLLERLGLDELTTPPPKDTSIRTTPSPGIRRPGAKTPSPLPLTSPARNPGPVSPGFARTPLSATHPPPETPLKHTRNEPQTPATPHNPLYSSAPINEERTSGLGLGLTPHKPTIPLEEHRDGSPSDHLTKETAGNQIEAMLERLRKAKSGLGTSASMWAPKPEVAAASDKLSSATRSGARKKPGHRHNGLQLSLGQEIDVPQNVDEKAEDEAEMLTARMGENWLGNVVPPTPVLGRDSPDNTPNPGTGGFWGAMSGEARRNSLLPSMEESGDDDDDEKPPPANLTFKSSRTPSPLSPDSDVDADADEENEVRERAKARRKRGRRDSKNKEKIETQGLASAFGLEAGPKSAGEKEKAKSPSAKVDANALEQKAPSTAEDKAHVAAEDAPGSDVKAPGSEEAPPAAEDAAPEAEEAPTPEALEEVPSTPKVGGGDTTFSGLDWAADDSDLSDTLPDLDDWGITVTPSKALPPRMHDKPVSSPLLDGAKFSMHAPTGPRIPSGPRNPSATRKNAPPAATPYGRWKSPPEQPQGISIKGVAAKQPPPAPSIKKERPSVRPRVAADSGAFTRLMGAAGGGAAPPRTEPAPAATNGKAPANGKKSRGGRKRK